METLQELYNSFGGTSSSCPGPAGVLHLQFQLIRRLQELKFAIYYVEHVSKSMRKMERTTQVAIAHFMVYGRLDAAAAVNSPKQRSARLSIFRKLVNAPIPDLGKIQEELDVGESAAVDGFIVSIRLEHSYIGDLVITLVPPANSGLSKVVLHNRAGGRTKNLDRQYSSATTPALAAYVGKSCKGGLDIPGGRQGRARCWNADSN